MSERKLEWVYTRYRQWVLVAEDGEVLAELKPSDGEIFEYGSKRYLGAENAKAAVMRDAQWEKNWRELGPHD